MSRLQKLLRPETKERQELHLPLGPDRALAACRGAAGELAWTVVADPEDEGRLTVREDFTRIACDKSPVRLHVEVRPWNGSGTSRVKIEATTAGVGGIASTHVRQATRAFVLRVARKTRED